MLEYSNFTGRVPAVNKSTTCCLYGIPEREVWKPRDTMLALTSLCGTGIPVCGFGGIT